MSTLAVVEKILRETAVPMSVREIVEKAGEALPTRSRTPDTVVARDLSMDIKKKGEASLFTRTSPGRYTMREIHCSATPQVAAGPQVGQPPAVATQTTPVLASALSAARVGTLPARASTANPVNAVTGEDDGLEALEAQP